MINNVITKDIYDIIIGNKKNRTFPVYNKPNISQENIKNGFIFRYFIRQSNNINCNIVEIDKIQYEKFKNDYFYTKLILKWKITGNKQDIYDENLKTLYKSENIMKGILDKYKNNLLEYVIQ